MKATPASPLVGYRGPGLTEEKVTLAAFCLSIPSLNTKLGDMTQSATFVDVVPPPEAAAEQLDRAICGSCPARRCHHGYCFANFPYWLQNIWYRSKELAADLRRVCDAIRRRRVPHRFGYLGDPVAVPIEVNAAILEAAVEAGGWTMYVRAFERADGWFRDVGMASAHTPEERARAKDFGFRTYRMKLPEEAPLKGEVVCPGSVEAGRRIQCDRCLLCSGHSGRGKTDIVVNVHGSAKEIHGYRRFRDSLRRNGDTT